MHSIGAPMTTSPRPTLRQSVALVWRTLRSMRTALILLLILAAAAVIGSLLPQVPNSPERVGQYLGDHGFWGPLFFRAGFFDVYASWWFVLITAPAARINKRISAVRIERNVRQTRATD